MGKMGGARPGAGRKPYGSNAGYWVAKTTKWESKHAAMVGMPGGPEVKIEVEDGCTPLEFLTKVYKHPDVSIFLREDAAKAAAQYTHPRLVAVAATVGNKLRIEITGGLPPLPGTATVLPPVIEGVAVAEAIAEDESSPAQNLAQDEADPAPDLFDDPPDDSA